MHVCVFMCMYVYIYVYECMYMYDIYHMCIYVCVGCDNMHAQCICSKLFVH